MDAQTLEIIDDPARARTALQPIRLQLLHLLERPQSAPQLAKATGMPRQRVLYHLRRLEAQQLVEAHEHGTVGRRIDRSYVRTATSYAIAPKTLGGVARWFGPYAAVTPGEGGSVSVGWDPKEMWDTPITVWEPQRRMQTASEMPTKEGG